MPLEFPILQNDESFAHKLMKCLKSLSGSKSRKDTNKKSLLRLLQGQTPYYLLSSHIVVLIPKLPKSGLDALFWNAIEEGYEDQVEILLDYVDVNRVKGGMTPLELAASLGRMRSTLLLLNNKNLHLPKGDRKSKPLFYIIRRNSEENKIQYIKILDLLLKKGIKVNCKNEGGESPIHEACYKANILAVEYLLQRGADIQAKTK